MTSAKTRKVLLVLASLAFGAWITYLIVLAIISRRPVVLSRPQLLVADVVVIARVEDREAGKGKVVRIVWAKEKTNLTADQEIAVANLSSSTGWTTAEEYILPLTVEGGIYMVTRLPRTPGYARSPTDAARIYPLTPQTERQLEELKPPR
jgi:hypothetical protein